MEKYLPYIALAVTLFGFAFSYFRTKVTSDVLKEIALLKQTVDGLVNVKPEIEVLKKQVSLFWGVVEKQMSTFLHSPHREDLDKLLDKNTRGERLKQEEAVQLVSLLQKLIDSGELNGDEKSFATMLMAVTIAKYDLHDSA